MPEQWDSDYNNGYIQCLDCGARVETAFENTTPTETWNKRATPWISVDNRLPEYSEISEQFILFLDNKGVVHHGIYDHEDKAFFHNGRKFQDVKDWMPVRQRQAV